LGWFSFYDVELCVSTYMDGFTNTGLRLRN